MFLVFAISSLLILLLSNIFELSKFSFAVTIWTVNIAGVLAAIISSNKVARIIFFAIIALNLIAVCHIAYVSLSNSEAPVGALALVALIFNVNVWLGAMGASAALEWQSATKYTKSENGSNWTKIDQGEDPTL